MNDAEFEELIERENTARVLGFTSNRYVCIGCLRDGKSESDSTYLDWPIEGLRLCDNHTPKCS